MERTSFDMAGHGAGKLVAVKHPASFFTKLDLAFLAFLHEFPECTSCARLCRPKVGLYSDQPFSVCFVSSRPPDWRDTGLQAPLEPC